MTNSIRALATAAAVVLSLTSAPAVHAQSPRGDIEAIIKDYLAAHPEEIERVVKDYLLKHPETVQQAIAELLKKRLPAAAATTAAPGIDKTALVRQNATALFNSTHQVTLGDPQGDVTMVEFIDYNCGFCKRALDDTLALLKDDPRLKVVLKEFPVLGPGSLEAGRVAVAVRMQDPTGAKYLEFHQRLLRASGPADKTNALAAAQAVGLDIERLNRDLDGDEVRQSLEESAGLARALGLNGTPSYVIGNNVVFGAVGLAALRDKIKAARQ